MHGARRIDGFSQTTENNPAGIFRSQEITAFLDGLLRMSGDFKGMRHRAVSFQMGPAIAGETSPISRRDMLARCSLGFGALALMGLLPNPSHAAAPAPHFRPKVKHVIFAYMSGGVSHVDSWDPKPELDRRHGQPIR